MSASYFFESVQPFNQHPTGVPGELFFTEQQRVWLRTTGYWNYPMGTVAKTPGGLWVHSAPPQPAYSTREKAADALHEWFEREAFASTHGGPQA